MYSDVIKVLLRCSRNESFHLAHFHNSVCIQSRFKLYRTPLRIFITHIYGIETLRLIIMKKYGNVVRFTGYSSVLIFSFCFVNFRSLYPLLILNSTFFSEMSTKRILTPTAIKVMMISWHQKGKSLKEIADLTGKPRSTVQSIIKKWKETGCVENQWCKGRPSTFSTRDANRLKRIVKTNVLTIRIHSIHSIHRPHFQNLFG